ncbi:MAG: sugar transferase [Dehalococcoidia bacterium]|nr:sugar transferase [Dehalococcoidia bacterium]
MPRKPSVRSTLGQALSPAETVAQPRPPSDIYNMAGKRLADLVIGGALLLLTAPLVLVLGLAVVLGTGWPAFYRARRIGKDGRVFGMWKLRTMVHDADQLLEDWRRDGHHLRSEYEQRYKITEDPRVTRLGRFLRKTSLDELPQFWNVIKGDMSLVGPRPVTGRETDLYESERELLLSVRPGVTGAWQVAGRSLVPYNRRMELELDYCRHPTLGRDLAILARTPLAIISTRGAS